MSAKHRNLIVVCVIIGVAAALRIKGMALASYWSDEMVSLDFGSSNNWRSVLWDNNPPLYHLLLKVWIQLFGLHEYATRSLSVLFSTVAVAVLMRAAYEERGLRAAWITGLLYGISHMSIAFSHETRMYSMFECAAAVSLLWLLRLLKHLSRRNLKGFAGAAAFLGLSHFLALIPLFLEACVLAFARASRRVSRMLRALPFVGAVLVIVAAFYHSFHWESIAWQRAKYELEPTSRLPLRIFFEMLEHSWGFAGLALLALGGGAALGSRERRHRYLMLATLALGPFALMFVVQPLLGRAVFLPRYFVYVLPPFWLWLALSVDETLQRLEGEWSRWWPPVAVFSLLAPAVVTLPLAYEPVRENWRDAARLIAERGKALVLTTSKPAIRIPYFNELGIPVRQWDLADPYVLPRLASALHRYDRVWLAEVHSNAGPLDDVERWAATNGIHVERFTVPTGTYSAIFLMLLEAPSS